MGVHEYTSLDPRAGVTLNACIFEKESNVDLPKVQVVTEVDGGSWVLGKLQRLDEVEARVRQLQTELVEKTKQVESPLPGLAVSCSKCEVTFSVVCKRTAAISHCPFCGHRRWLSRG